MSFSVVGVGEILWDFLPGGPQIGGAPGNFACHARALGARSSVITRVGDDELGRSALDRFEKMGLPLKTVQVDPRAPTGTARVTLDHSGIPCFHFQNNVAWDHLEATARLIEVVQSADAICFGSLAQRTDVSRAAIQQLLAAAPEESLRIFDVNLRGDFYSRAVIEQSLGVANALKLNDGELAILAELFAIDGSPRIQIQWLAEKFQLKMVALTSGEKGSSIYSGADWSEQLPAPTAVVDTVGAGDAFTAALVMGLLAKMPLQHAHAFANNVASFVCSQPGATPVLPLSLRDKCQFLPMAG